jgi:polyisoprenoid-binding protein YceI
MTQESSAQPSRPADARVGAWSLDPARSSVEFHVRHFYGLVTVKGSFKSYTGTLDLNAEPAVQLTIKAASLDTNKAKRDKHLRSADFFDVDHHPQVRFVSDRAALDGQTLTVSGQLHAAGNSVRLEFHAHLRPLGDELGIEAITEVDHRQLGMHWSPLGILRAPSKLLVRGLLVPEKGVQS